MSEQVTDRHREAVKEIFAITVLYGDRPQLADRKAAEALSRHFPDEPLRQAAEAAYWWFKATLKDHVIGAKPLVVDAWKMDEIRETLRQALTPKGA